MPASAPHSSRPHGRPRPLSRKEAARPSRLASAWRRPARSREPASRRCSAHRIWEKEINAKGGLLGRPVKLIYYDDQTNPSTVPGIYAKLLDVDKVDLVIGPYGTNLVAPTLPAVMPKGKTLIGLFALDANHDFHYPKYFSMLPSGPTPKQSFTDGFFSLAAAQNPKPQTVAI